MSELPSPEAPRSFRELPAGPLEAPRDTAEPQEPPGDGAEPRAGEGASAGHAVVTGNPEVDAVLASLTDLGGRPVSEHVRVFEEAHHRLRGVLTVAGDEPDGS